MANSQNGWNTGVVSYPRSSCGIDHRKNIQGLGVVVGKVSGEDWFVVGSPVPQAAKTFQVPMQIPSCTGDVGECVLQNGYP